MSNNNNLLKARHIDAVIQGKVNVASNSTVALKEDQELTQTTSNDNELNNVTPLHTEKTPKSKYIRVSRAFVRHLSECCLILALTTLTMICCLVKSSIDNANYRQSVMQIENSQTVTTIYGTVASINAGTVTFCTAQGEMLSFKVSPEVIANLNFESTYMLAYGDDGVLSLIQTQH